MLYYYYYFRDEKNRPVQTYCLLFIGGDTTGDYARGIAVCSKKDHPCKKIGRAIAAGRAFKSLVHKKDFYDKGGHMCTSSFLPPLTEYEQKIIANTQKAKK